MRPFSVVECSCLVCAAFWSVLRLWVLVPLVEWVQVGSGVVCFEVLGSNSALSKSSHWWGAVEEAAGFFFSIPGVQVWIDWSGQDALGLPGSPVELEGVG